MAKKSDQSQPQPQPLADGILEVPATAVEAIERDSQLAGGAWEPSPEREGSVGTTMFDMPASSDGTVTVLLPQQNLDALPNQALVRIESLSDKRTYLGAVAEGPFAEPDGLRADSTPMVVTTLQGGLMLPKHHGRVQVELLGERNKSGSLVPPRRRPKPNSPVFALDSKETADVLQIRGNLRVGLADGFDDLVIKVPAESKSLFPRHLGILGTTGGGKSTTVSGLVAKAQQEGIAIVLIDVEGEYCAIHEPTSDEKMLEELKNRGLKESGVPNTHLYHLVGRDTANAKHPSKKQFSLKYSNLSPYAIKEILQLSDPQEERFLKAYEVTKRALESFKIWPKTSAEKAQAFELDEFETGFPNMTLAHMLDVVSDITSVVNKDEEEGYLETEEFRNKRSQLRQLYGKDLPGHINSWKALCGKLWKMKRLKIFDVQDTGPINYAEMLVPGRVSIVDLSDTESPQVRNLVIAELLRGIQDQQEDNYKKATDAGKLPTPTMIFIEEAHEFLSAERIKKMEVLFAQVAKIARRGRKRWLGLVFVTQFPQHLPDEVLGLINNWVLHKISDATVVSRLQRSIGGISSGHWKKLISLASGQAIASFTTMTRPLQVSIDPTPCKLLMVE